MEKIIPQGMYDSEKWASDYIEVRGNYQYPLGEYGLYEVPRHRGDPSKHSFVSHLRYSIFPYVLLHN